MNNKQAQNKINKERKHLEKIKKEKTKYLVRARKGELWMDECKDHYYNVVCKRYDFCVRHIENMIDVKHTPLIGQISFHLSMFSRDLLYLFKYRKFNREIIEDYWEWKKIKKEWEDDFEYTQKRIDEDYETVEKMEPFVRKMEKILNEWDYNLSRRPGRVKAKRPKTGARVKNAKQ